MEMAEQTEKTTKGLNKKKCERKNLISLVWPVNTCYSILMEGVPKGVTVDLIAGTWTFRRHSYAIGSQRCYYCCELEGYPINVYDRTNINHLQEMKRDIEWVKERFRAHFGDD